jgi:PST family polysaccharide transporter
MGTAAMSTTSTLRLLAQFFAVPILSRLLSPEEYGLVGVAMPFVLFAMMIADAGIGMSLVRTPASERRVWSTCFWLTVLLGLALSAIMVAFAPLAAMLFEEAELFPIIAALALTIFAQSLCTVPGAALQQKQRFHAIAGLEIVAVMSGIGVAVWMGMHGFGAWALVGQQLAFFALRLVGTFALAGFRPLWVLDIGEVKEHLRFGRDMLSTNIVGFFSRSSDNWVIGKMLDVAAVGHYAMAIQFARLPMMLISGPLQYVLYSHLAPIRDDKEAIRRTFLVLSRLLATIVFPIMGLLAAAHAPFFAFLLSSKWADSGVLFMLVAPASALQAVTALVGTVRTVLGRTDLQLRISIEFACVWLVALLVSVSYGLEWAAMAFNAVVILYTPRALMLTLPLIGCSLLAYARTLIRPALVTAVCIIGYQQLSHVWSLEGLEQVGFVIVWMGVGVLLGVAVQWSRLKKEFGLWKNA